MLYYGECKKGASCPCKHDVDTLRATWKYFWKLLLNSPSNPNLNPSQSATASGPQRKIMDRQHARKESF